MIQGGKRREFAMGRAVSVRTDYTAGEVRRFAKQAKDAAQARRLLAIAAVLDGASREDGRRSDARPLAGEGPDPPDGPSTSPRRGVCALGVGRPLLIEVS